MPAKRVLCLADYKTIHELAAEGAHDKVIARALHVCLATWKAIRQRDPKALAALRWGRREFYASAPSVVELFDPLPQQEGT